MTEIGPGTPLICINANPPVGAVGSLCETLTLGALYTCLEVQSDPESLPCPWDQCGTTGIQLREKYCSCYATNWAFCPNLFRPLNDGDTSLVEDELESKNRHEDMADALAYGLSVMTWSDKK